MTNFTKWQPISKIPLDPELFVDLWSISKKQRLVSCVYYPKEDCWIVGSTFKVRREDISHFSIPLSDPN